MIYLYFKTNGEVEKIESEKVLPLERLQELVGGMIEFAPVEKDGSQPVVNEEGLLNMLPRNPFFKPEHQGYYAGNILLGKDVEGNFMGFDEIEVDQYMRKVMGYDQAIFKKDKLFTIISIGDFMAQTTKTEIKATGELSSNNRPVFKENIKGARKKFTLRNLEDNETMLFEGEVPFKIDGEVSSQSHSGMSCRVMRGNALFNFHGDAEVIKEWVMTKNLNPFFTAYDKVNLIEDSNNSESPETLLFIDVPTTSQSVMDRRQGQLKRASK